MCQPRDILDQMISIAKYNMERVNFSPDLIDAACATYFISSRAEGLRGEGADGLSVVELASRAAVATGLSRTSRFNDGMPSPSKPV